MKTYINGTPVENIGESDVWVDQQSDQSKREALSYLLDYAHKITQAYPEIEEIRIFGQFLHSTTFEPHSMVDLLIILSQTTIPIERRHQAYAPHQLYPRLQIYPLTREEIDKAIRVGNTTLSKVLERSVLLHQNPIEKQQIVG